MFGFRLPPDGGTQKLPKESDSSDSSSSSDSETDSTSTENSKKFSNESEEIAVYEDYMPDEVPVTQNPTAGSELPTASTSSSSDANQLLETLTKNITTYLSSIAQSNSKTSEAESGEDKKKSKKDIKKVLSEKKKNDSKKIAKLRRRASTLARLGKSYNEKIENFLKELN